MKKVLALLVVVALVGCAKFPKNGSGALTKRLTFTMTVAGEINPNFIYIIALRPSNDVNPTTDGPKPVVGPPWGNGFVSGNATYFVRWDPLTSPAYILYKFQPGTDTGDPNNADLTQFAQVGTPIAFQDVPNGGRTIQFELDLSQIADSVDAANLFQSLQVNFLTMDKAPTGTTPVNKALDAIGDSRLPSQINDWLTIPLRTTGVFDNNHFSQIEPTGDVQDPDLDISDFSIEVRTQ
jgi:hypothetical protein